LRGVRDEMATMRVETGGMRDEDTPALRHGAADGWHEPNGWPRANAVMSKAGTPGLEGHIPDRGPPAAAALHQPLREHRRVHSGPPTVDGAKMNKLAISFAVAIVLCGCALERARVANEAQVSMIGFSKEQTLACMGPPANKAVEGSVEVWSYESGDGTRVAIVDGVSSGRFCKINITMDANKIRRIDYLGPTGGFISRGEQCAFALQQCVKQ
jgi:hypothetical protein